MPRQTNYFKNYYIKNKDRIDEYHRNHHAKNRESINEKKRIYRSLNPELGGSYGFNYQKRHKKENRSLINERQRNYRKSHPHYFLRYNKKRNEKEKLRRIAFKEKINLYKSERGCVDCGIKNPIVLDFDHIGHKLFNIANGAARNPEKVKLEIAKCEIRCSNCHRIKTHERRRSSC